MDQPPALKTRRSNAVHTRRLALHFSLLERHMAALETERARAVRQLHQELSHLHVPRRLPEVSPRNALSVGHGQYDRSKEQQENRLPRLNLSENFPVHENNAMTSPPIHQPSVMNEGFPPVTTHPDLVLKNENNSNVQLHDDSTKQSDSPLTFRKGSRNSLASFTRAAPGSKGGVYLWKAGSSSTRVPYTVGLPFKTRIIPRASRSLPPSGQYRGHGQTLFNSKRHNQLDSLKDSKNEGETLKERLPDVKLNETTSLPQSFGDSESTQLHGVKTAQQATQPLQGLEPMTYISTTQSETQTSPFHAEINAPTTTEDVLERPQSDGISKSVEGLDRHHKQCHVAGSPRDRCSYFPCREPPTYHSLGFHPDLSTHTWRQWLLQNACRPHHRLAPGRPPPAGLDGRRTPADAPGYVRRKRLGKEELVRLDMARNKCMHARARPPSWNTNYGQPTPYKRLKYPARLKPLL